jgi:DNA-binding MarR family transcriptional regulator/GNAT superfamily N-acetyltransferase
MAITSPQLPARIEALRRFNRFYTKRIGVLDEGLLKSQFSLTEARLIYELAHRAGSTLTDLAAELALDAGYVSRLIGTLESRGIIDKSPGETDRRKVQLRLSPAGVAAFDALDEASQQELAALLSLLSDAQQARLLQATRQIESLLCSDSAPRAALALRTHEPGDLGWVIWRHAELYAKEYGWNEEFEALVAGIVARFVRSFDARLERCWLAERDGERLGSVFLVKESETVGRLRLLLVEPTARGLGVGRCLVETCIRFARQVRYEKLTLWTNDVLVAARHIYEVAGFRLTHQAPHRAFGQDLVEQTWELDL